MQAVDRGEICFGICTTTTALNHIMHCHEKPLKAAANKQSSNSQQQQLKTGRLHVW